MYFTARQVRIYRAGPHRRRFPMLPADTIAAITTNLAALQLEPTTAAQILVAVLGPLLRPEQPSAAPALPPQRIERPRRRLRRAARSKPQSSSKKRRYKRRAPSEARDRALAALKANPTGTTSELAKTAGVSRATVVKARKELAKETRRQARKTARTRATSKPANPNPRHRAER